MIGKALDGLVGDSRALSLQHQLRDDVLGGDQLDPILLALYLATQRGGERRIGVEPLGEVAVVKHGHEGDPRWKGRRDGGETPAEQDIAKLCDRPQTTYGAAETKLF